VSPSLNPSFRESSDKASAACRSWPGNETRPELSNYIEQVVKLKRRVPVDDKRPAFYS
jgi:hypothetical protein